MSEIQRIVRERRLTPEEIEKYRRIREQVEAELPEMIARDRLAPGHASREDVAEIEQLVAFLHAERERQGIDLAEIAYRTRYKLEDLELLEGNRYPNPPIAMLTRYARALGRRVLLVSRQGEPWRDPRKHVAESKT
jgi:hypothetical protein